MISKTNEIDDYIIRLDDFNRASNIEEEIEDEFDINLEKIKKSSDPEEYLILETGFYAYFLYRYYQDYDSTKKTTIDQEPEKHSLLKAFNSTRILFLYLG